MRILFDADIKTSNGFYRALSPMRALAKHGHAIRQTDSSESLAVLKQFDVLLIHRRVDDETLRLARAADDNGLAVIWDNDDDFAGVRKGTRSYKDVGGLNYERRRVGMKRMFEICEFVTSPSHVLSEVHRGLGARRVDVIPNRISERELIRPQTRKGTVLIGWVAASEHRMDERELRLVETLDRMLQRVPHARMTTVGMSLDLRSDRYEHSNPIPRQKLIEHIARFDIGIAPLADFTLSRARSDIKVREYAAAGVAWLASPVGPYVGWGRDQGGMLVAADQWEEALVALANDDKRRKKLSNAARKWAASETTERRVSDWESLLTRALEARHSR